jgi:serine/threonine protein kinase
MMPRHLQPVLNETVRVVRKNIQQVLVPVEISIMNAFAIENQDHFFAYAEKVIDNFKGKLPSKLERKIGINGEGYTCSFVNHGSAIYAISRDIIGKGQFGRVKLALNISNPNDTRLYVIKVQAIKPSDRFVDNLIQTEADLGNKIGYFLHPLLQRNRVGKHDQNKYYTLSLFGGITLTQWINERKPSDEKRLQVAIRLCQQVYELHEKGYAHGDLKPDNVLIDPITEEVSLVDFGFIGPLKLHPMNITMKGSLSGLPFFEDDDMPKVLENNARVLLIRMQAFGVLRLETFALMRLLDAPFHLPKFKDFGPSLLSPNLLNPLYEWIDTSSEKSSLLMPIRNPLTLMTLLVLHYYNQDLPTILKLTKIQQLAILSIYRNEHFSDEQKKSFICLELCPQPMQEKRNPFMRFSRSSIDELPHEESISFNTLTPTPQSVTGTPLRDTPSLPEERSPSRMQLRLTMARVRSGMISPFFPPSEESQSRHPTQQSSPLDETMNMMDEKTLSTGTTIQRTRR